MRLAGSNSLLKEVELNTTMFILAAIYFYYGLGCIFVPCEVLFMVFKDLGMACNLSMLASV